MRILGIETSCDETAVAIVENGLNVVSNTITSTKDVFAHSGGVVPEDAARRQVECILPVVHACLHSANMQWSDIDAIAVTKGPGLFGSLLVGTTTARVLSSLYKKPLIGVHHTFGHLSSTFLEREQDTMFPCIALSVSGGHSDLWHRTSHTNQTLLGSTRDDAAGEAFDKGARMLGLPYPGGPSISNSALQGNEKSFLFPNALEKESTYDFSFSGLKTALKYTIADLGTDASTRTSHLAASFQLAICTQLVSRVQKACADYPDVSSVHVVGGVSANMRLRELIETLLPKHTLCVPKKISYCTDNAAMIAAAGYFLQKELGDNAYRAFETQQTLSLESR